MVRFVVMVIVWVVVMDTEVVVTQSVYELLFYRAVLLVKTWV